MSLPAYSHLARTVRHLVRLLTPLHAPRAYTRHNGYAPRLVVRALAPSAPAMNAPQRAPRLHAPHLATRATATQCDPLRPARPATHARYSHAPPYNARLYAPTQQNAPDTQRARDESKRGGAKLAPPYRTRYRNSPRSAHALHQTALARHRHYRRTHLP